jgi:hypothetical protein
MTRVALVVAIVLAAYSGRTAYAEGATVVGRLKISAAWVRATPRGAPVDFIAEGIGAQTGGNGGTQMQHGR